MIVRHRISSGAIDASGNAAAYSKAIRGKILSVSINYPAHTCTVDLDEADSLKNQKILDLAAANTDATYNPRTPTHNYDGSTVDLSDTEGGDTAQYEPFVVHGRIKLTIASGTEGEEVTVDIIAEQ